MRLITIIFLFLSCLTFGQSKYYLSSPYITGHDADTANGFMMENTGTGYVGLYLINSIDTIKLHEHPDGYTVLDLPAYLSITKNVGIGTTNPGALLHVAHTTGFTSIFQRSNTTAGGSPVILFRRTRGTIDSPDVVQTADILGQLAFEGYITGSTYNRAASILSKANGINAAGTYIGGNIVLPGTVTSTNK